MEEPFDKPVRTWQEPAPPVPRHLAPLWHTVLLVVLLLAFSGLSAGTQQSFTLRNGRIILYLATMIWEWVLLGYVLFGLWRGKTPLRQVVGGRWNSTKDVWLDVGIAIGFWVIAALVLAALGSALGLARPGATDLKRHLAYLAPRSRMETGLWILLSATAGFCEEIIFRGYLQQQFAILWRKLYAGVLISAAIFGLSHAYEGGKRMLLIAVYGVMFGLLAVWRKSLRPGMLGHALHDGVSGILLRMVK